MELEARSGVDCPESLAAHPLEPDQVLHLRNDAIHSIFSQGPHARSQLMYKIDNPPTKAFKVLSSGGLLIATRGGIQLVDKDDSDIYRKKAYVDQRLSSVLAMRVSAHEDFLIVCDCGGQ